MHYHTAQICAFIVNNYVIVVRGYKIGATIIDKKTWDVLNILSNFVRSEVLEILFTFTSAKSFFQPYFQEGSFNMITAQLLLRDSLYFI